MTSTIDPGFAMKRSHVHVHVEDQQTSVAIHSKLFNAKPTRLKGDYAQGMLDDPRIDLAICTRGVRNVGVDHLGIQVDTPAELDGLKLRAETTKLTMSDVGETTCCYAGSDKFSLTDPQGIPWEQFRTLGQLDGATCPVLCASADNGPRDSSASTARCCA